VIVKLQRRRKKTAVFIVLAASVAVVLALFRPWEQRSGYLAGEAGRISPVLKPSGLEGRSFFLLGSRYLLRLGPEDPILRWKLDQGANGELSVTFQAAPKGKPVPPFGFSVSSTDGDGSRRELFSETWAAPPASIVTRRIKAGIALSAGAEIDFRLSAATIPGSDVLDAGIIVPRITTEGAGKPPSDVLIVSIDALRRDVLGIYQSLAGHPPALSLSPEIDRFSENAVVFLNARTTQSSTWPALSSLHLSAYPRAHGVTENRTFLDAPGGSIATLLRGRGYATLALGSNAIALNLPGFEEKKQYFRADDRLLAAGRERITEQAAAPFFHWYHLFGCHDQYFPPEWVMKIVARDVPGYVHRRIPTNDLMSGKIPCGPEEVAAVRRLYQGALYYVDSLLKETFDDLKRRGLWDDTLVVVTSDHGEELYEHNRYFHHSPSLYDGALRVPLLIKFPGQRGRRVVRENVSHIDILPTLHHYFAGRPEAGRYAGLSLLDLLDGKTRPFRDRVLFAEAEGSRVVAAVLGSRKLIHNPSGIMPMAPLSRPFPMGPIEFYDLDADPGETRNLAASDDPVLRRLLAESSRYIREALEPKTKKKPGEGIEMSEEERKDAEEALRSLGYIK
jgi:choline-sulfatase